MSRQYLNAGEMCNPRDMNKQANTPLISDVNGSFRFVVTWWIFCGIVSFLRVRNQLNLNVFWQHSWEDRFLSCCYNRESLTNCSNIAAPRNKRIQPAMSQPVLNVNPSEPGLPRVLTGWTGRSSTLISINFQAVIWNSLALNQFHRKSIFISSVVNFIDVDACNIGLALTWQHFVEVITRVTRDTLPIVSALPQTLMMPRNSSIYAPNIALSHHCKCFLFECKAPCRSTRNG